MGRSARSRGRARRERKTAEPYRHFDDCHPTKGNGGSARTGKGESRGGETRSIFFPRQHQPRNTHAPARHHASPTLALLKEKTPPHRYLRAILQSSRALLEIINDLLDVSKIEAGHLELEQAPFMLDDVVHHVCTVALHNAHAGGIELVVDMDRTCRSR